MRKAYIELLKDSESMNVTMAFDRLGRRVWMRESEGDAVTKEERFVYDGYLCVQRLDATQNNAVRTEFVWDPTEPIATRPLAMRAKNWGLNLFYSHDGNKNVSEVFYHAPQNGIAAHYDYAPFGAVSRTSRATRVTNRDLISENPFRFSSEYHDAPTSLVYYNYRHYQTYVGRWCTREPLEEMTRFGIYGFVKNSPTFYVDCLGLEGKTTHGTRKCDKCDSCDQLFKQTALWVAHYNERYDELMLDKYNFKKNNPRKYNNHIQKLHEAEKNALNCVALLTQKVLNGECSSPIPEIDFATKPIPSPLPEQMPQLSPQKFAPIELIPPVLILFNMGGGAGGGGAPLFAPVNKTLLWN